MNILVFDAESPQYIPYIKIRKALNAENKVEKS